VTLCLFDTELHSCGRTICRDPVFYVLSYDDVVYFVYIIYFCCTYMSVFYTVGSASERASGLQKLSDEVLAWLSVWSEVQMICIWSV